MTKKYKMTKIEGRNDRFRITALRDFGNVKKGKVGGIIEHEWNLSHNGNCWIGYDGVVIGRAEVTDNAIVERGQIHGDATISGCAIVRAHGYNGPMIGGNIIVTGNAIIDGDVRLFLFGPAKFSHNAIITDPSDFIYFAPIGSENGTLTAYKTIDGEIGITRGCFTGTLKEFKRAVKRTHKGNMYSKEYKLAIELIKQKLK